MWYIYAQNEKQKFSGHGAWRNEPQEVDSTRSEKEAKYLAREYALAYGQDWSVWWQQGKLKKSGGLGGLNRKSRKRKSKRR